MLEVILEYGQTISLFLVLIVMEGVIAAKTESFLPGLLYAFGMVAFSVIMGIVFHDIHFFGYMMIPTALCFGAFFFSRWNRRKNIEKGLHYNKEGLIEEEMKDMERF